MHLIQELDKTRDETLKYFTLGQDDLARTYGPGKWSIRMTSFGVGSQEVGSPA